MNKKSLRILSYTLCALVFITPALVLAQGTFVPLEPISTTKSGDLYGSGGDISTFLNNLFKFALAIGAIGAVLRLAYAGYLYMGAADMWSSKSEAKKVMGDVTLGLLLLLSIWLILYQINPDILTLNALKNIKPVQGGSSAPTQTTSASPADNTITHITPADSSGFNNAMPQP